MTAHLVATVVCFFAAIACAFAAQASKLSVMEEVNRRLPEPDRLDLVGWQRGKSRRFHYECRRLYPDGRKYALIIGLGVASYVLLGISMYLLWNVTHT